MFGDNISAEGQIGPSLRENVDTRKYFFPLNSLLFPASLNTGDDLLTLKGQGYFFLYAPDMYYGVLLEGCSREFIMIQLLYKKKSLLGILLMQILRENN